VDRGALAYERGGIVDPGVTLTATAALARSASAHGGATHRRDQRSRASASRAMTPARSAVPCT
jgi:glycine/D-amino acid oxidase-like deaminating enzyme